MTVGSMQFAVQGLARSSLHWCSNVARLKPQPQARLCQSSWPEALEWNAVGVWMYLYLVQNSFQELPNLWWNVFSARLSG